MKSRKNTIVIGSPGTNSALLLTVRVESFKLSPEQHPKELDSSFLRVLALHL